MSLGLYIINIALHKNMVSIAMIYCHRHCTLSLIHIASSFTPLCLITPVEFTLKNKETT